MALLAAVLGALAGAVYINSLWNPFVYDDLRVAKGIAPLHSFTDVASTIARDFTRPVVGLSYAFDSTFWGETPFGFHLTNVLLHMCNVVLLLHVARSIAADAPAGSGGGSSLSSLYAGFVAAAFFALHPLMTESVGYISGRSEVLCATSFLLAFMSARRWMQQGGRLWWLLTMVWWALALGTKEIAAALPVILYAYDRLILGSGTAGYVRRIQWLHAPMLALVIAAALLRLTVLLLVEYQADSGFDSLYVLVQADVILQYLGLLVLPRNQTIYHGEPLVLGPFWWRAAIDIAILAAGAVTIVWAGRRNRLIPLYTIWFAALIVPSSVLYVFGIGEAMAEHRVYLASAGVFMGAGWAAAWVVSRLRTRGQRVLFHTLLVILGMHLSARTIIRNDQWRDPVIIWSEAIGSAPGEWLPRVALADVHREANRCADAVPLYRSAMDRGTPDNTVYVKLAGCLMQLQRLDEARTAFATLSRVEPQAADGPLGLALIAIIKGSGDPKPDLREALSRDPNNVAARMLLASMLEPDDPAAALRLCREVQKMAPATEGVDACITRATTAVQSGQTPDP